MFVAWASVGVLNKFEDSLKQQILTPNHESTPPIAVNLHWKMRMVLQPSVAQMRPTTLKPYVLVFQHFGGYEPTTTKKPSCTCYSINSNRDSTVERGHSAAYTGSLIYELFLARFPPISHRVQWPCDVSPTCLTCHIWSNFCTTAGVVTSLMKSSRNIRWS